MPIRIYALAKEIDIDSKELVEICKKAGITGKGSALASLNDEEVDKVKAYLRGPTKKPEPARPEPAPLAPQPPERPSPPAAPVEAAPSAPSVSPPAPSRQAAAAEDASAAIKREDYIPAKGSGKIKVISKGGKVDRKAEAPGGSKKPKRREPVINVAKMPEVKQPTVTPAKPEEQKAQKPDIRLPKDAIEGHKRGLRPPLEHLTKTDRKATKEGRRPEAGEEEAPKKPPRRGRAAPAATTTEGSGEEEVGMAGMAASRANRQNQRKRRQTVRSSSDSSDSEPAQRYRPRTLKRTGTNTAAPRKGKVTLELPCTVRSFSEAAGVSAAQVQRVLIGLGVMATINAQIEDDMVELVAAELGVELEYKQQESLEDSLFQRMLEEEDNPDDLQARPPVITFLGHVDHGKTSLLDYIIGTEVVKGEAGGITQHIRAYQINKDGRKISFVDTPGHEAFTEMRARGANVTDIAVLVVAADDGIMPQTEEAISHAKAAGVPIVVALNKIDLPGVDPNKTMAQLTEHGLTPSEWGGEVEVVRTSAISGQGMDDLLETLLTVAELHEYRANANRTAVGSCLEAEQEAGRGVIAKLMVKKGTLRVGDVVVCGSTYGRIKAMYDTLRPGERVEEAGPSVPVNVTGFEAPPEAGEPFVVLEDIAQARDIAAERESRTRERSLSGITTRISFEDFQQRLASGRLSSGAEDLVNLNLIIRADVRGSIEAIQKELEKLRHPEVQIKVLQASVGGITVADVTLAHASEAVIIGFNVIPDEAARSLADDRHVEIRRYDVIYKVTDDIKALLEGRLKPEQRTVELGQAIVKQVFPIGRTINVAGCYVVRGSIERNCRIRVNRDGRTIGDYPLESLRREKDDVREVSRGLECGIKLAGFNDVKKDDVLEAYKIEEVARTL